MTAKTAATAPAEPEAPAEPVIPSREPLAEEALAAMPEGHRDLYGPLTLAPVPSWRPWSLLDACVPVTADECDDFVDRECAAYSVSASRWQQWTTERIEARRLRPAPPLPVRRTGPMAEPPPGDGVPLIIGPRDGWVPDPDGMTAVLPRAAEADPEPAPVLPGEPADEAADEKVQRAAQDALRRAGTDPEDLRALAEPGDGRDAHDAAEAMTAVLPVPEQGEQQ
jgi:hypothetical protein